MPSFIRAPSRSPEQNPTPAAGRRGPGGLQSAGGGGNAFVTQLMEGRGAMSGNDPAAAARGIVAAVGSGDEAEAVRLAQGLAGKVREAVAHQLQASGEFDKLPVAVHRLLQPQAARVDHVRGKGDRIDCESVIRIEGAVQWKDIEAAVYADWSPWFAGSAIHDHVKLGAQQGGGVKFHFDPVAFWATGHAAFEANVHLLPPQAESGGVWRVPMVLSGDLVGSDVYFEFRQVSGGWIMRSVWNGVQEKTPLGPETVGKAHTAVETDTMSPLMNAISPAIRGERGYVGLKHFLESRARGRSAGASGSW